jgi:uncharacterized RmlC-like cupin family protein
MPRPRVTLVKASDRKPVSVQTAGVTREEALTTGKLWAGIARTAPGMSSGWHHHGSWETIAYVVTGAVRLEFGPGGDEVVEGDPGDYLYIPGNLVHRESNPAAVEQTLVIVRVGEGPVTTNVEEPACRVEERP